MKVGYARVSSKTQNIDRQIEAFNEIGVDKIFQDKKTGTTFKDRYEFQKAIKFVREGDTLIVDSLERLGRNYDDIINTIQELDKKRVNLNVLNLPLLNQTLDDPLLQKLIRNLIIEIMSWVAEAENDERKRKQKQGIAIAKSKGIYKGRKTKYTLEHVGVKHAIELRESTNKTVEEICNITGLSPATFYRRWKEHQKNISSIVVK